MKEIMIINNSFAQGGFTSGNTGIWTRSEPNDPPTDDYSAFSEKLGIPLSGIVRPYQASGIRVETVTASHGGSGVIKDNDLKKVDGLVTAEKGLVLSVIAADCVPIYLLDEKATAIGLLHCGWRSAAGNILRNAVERMKELGSSPAGIQLIIGPHICPRCYEVGEELRNEYAEAFTERELGKLFTVRGEKMYLSLSQAIRIKAAAEGIPDENISDVKECTFCDKSYYSYRRCDRGKQNMAFLMMK